MWKNTCELKFLLEGLECYNDTCMKAYNITKLTNELKNSDNVRYIIKLLNWSFLSAWLSEVKV